MTNTRLRRIDIPDHVGPCEFGTLGNQIAIRCPAELAHILRRAGAIWEPGSRRWLVQRRRVGPEREVKPPCRQSPRLVELQEARPALYSRRQG